MTQSESTVTEESELERTVGVAGALTIGIGTMIGAGIFVFPGLAAGRAGPAAALSFVVGGIVALLVALPTSELATAMPKSGGGYYFVSRSLGALPGAVVGIGLTFGLVFASAFYLVGFGEYAVAVLVEAGVVETTDVALGPLSVEAIFGSTTGIALTALSIFGTDNTEALQNTVVGVLLAILAVFLSISMLDLLGIRGQARLADQFAPLGFAPILTTAALIFTSYLGFAQIATVAEDIVEPERNLPLAMVGSVVIVSVLYVITVLLAGNTFEPAVIGPLGETAIVEVARVYLGLGGVIVILVAGLLATVSSANASILSASRAMYGLSSDALAPPVAARLNRTYGTPHVALSFVGGMVVVLVAIGRTETLAEVASFLHLIMYGLMCVALLVLRRSAPSWYDPAFECPGYPIVPAVGAIASFALIYYMHPLSQLLGLFVVLAAIAWYYLYADSVKLRGEFD